MGRRDAALATAVATAAFVVYAATLAPGLIAITDTPKFQFIGRILGTGHPPGYPLYVMVSHVFGYLPIGSLAYRINLMSAVLSAAACALTFLCARLLGVGRPAAAAAGLGLAFGSTVWYVSTIAEVYALNAVLVAAILLALLMWQRSGRATWFYTAVALVGLALGNHTTVVFLIPATALFACVVAPRFALRPRTIAIAAAIVALALTQYLFVIIRTRQGAWGDADAWNLADLARIMSGSEYFEDLMPGGIGPLLSDRLPLVWRMFVQEMSVVGVALAGLGAAALWRWSKAALAMLIVCLIEYALFAAVYTPARFEVFLIPGFIMGWLLAAAGAQWIVDRSRASGARWGAALAAGALAIAPAGQLARNYNARDLSHSRADMRFFDALFDRLPERAALLSEDFLVDRMVLYKTQGEQITRVLAPVPADLAQVQRLLLDRYEVFAFPQTAKQMRLLEGAEFSYAPLELTGGTLDGYLRDLRRGTVVAIGVPAKDLGSFAPGGRPPLEAIGFTKSLIGEDVGALAVIGVRGRAADSAYDRVSAHVRFDSASGENARAALPPIEVHADQDTAAIVFGGREIIRTGAGMAVAVWSGDHVTAAFVVPSAAPFPPTLATPYAVSPLRSIRERRQVGTASTDLTTLTASGNFVYKTGSGRSRLVLYAGRRRPLVPSLLESSARDWPAFDVKTFDGPHAPGGELSRALGSDELPSDSRLLAMPHVYRIAIDTAWPYAAAVVGLGGVPEIAYGRTTAGEPVLVYGLDLATHLRRIDDRTASLHMANDHHAHLVGAGWSRLQADAVAPYRETTDQEAELLMPIAKAGALRIGVQLLQLPGTGGPAASVELQFNDRPMPPSTAAPQWQRYWWDVPADAVRSGVNAVVLSVSPPGSRIAVSDVLVETKS